MKADARPNMDHPKLEATAMIEIVKDEYKLWAREYKAVASGRKVEFLRMRIV